VFPIRRVSDDVLVCAHPRYQAGLSAYLQRRPYSSDVIQRCVHTLERARNTGEEREKIEKEERPSSESIWQRHEQVLGDSTL